MRRGEVCRRQVEVTCAFGACAAHHPLDCEPLERVTPGYRNGVWVNDLRYEEAS